MNINPSTLSIIIVGITALMTIYCIYHLWNKIQTRKIDTIKEKCNYFAKELEETCQILHTLSNKSLLSEIEKEITEQQSEPADLILGIKNNIEISVQLMEKVDIELKALKYIQPKTLKGWENHLIEYYRFYFFIIGTSNINKDFEEIYNSLNLLENFSSKRKMVCYIHHFFTDLAIISLIETPKFSPEKNIRGIINYLMQIKKIRDQILTRKRGNNKKNIVPFRKAK